MKKTKSHAIFKKKLFEQQFKLPENFVQRVAKLENDLEERSLTDTGLKDLIDLYSVNYIIYLIYIIIQSASSHFEAIGNLNEFQNYFRKMQGIISHEKVQPLVRKRSPKKSLTISGIQEATLNLVTINKKNDAKEKIKSQLKDTKKESKEQATNMLKTFSNSDETHKVEVVGSELERQESSFKERLKLKKMTRASSNKDLKTLSMVLIYFLCI